MDWSTPASASNEHEGIVALPPWARKGPDAEADPAAEAAPEAPEDEPVPWWERNGQPVADRRREARGGPLRSAARRGAARVRLARVDAGAPGDAPEVTRRGGRVAIPAVPRASGGNRSRTLVIGAALAGVAAIGTPVMWKLAFASRPTVVSALPIEPAAAPAPGRAARRARPRHAGRRAGARRAARLPGSAAARA